LADKDTLINFAGLGSDDDLSSPATFNPYDQNPTITTRYAVISAPYEATVSYGKGASLGPAAILEASTHMELYDEELQSEPWRAGIETLPPLDILRLQPEEMVDAVHKASAVVIADEKIPVLLGGEHSVTLGLFRALKEKHPKLSVLHLDAHADMRAVYDGTPFSHACIARRMAEEGAPLVQLGIRSMSQLEALFLGDGGTGDILNVRSYQARQLRAGIDIKEVLAHLSDEVFITIDLDVFDPSIMPSTGTPEPGGLLWEEVLTILRSIISRKKIVGFDIVELSPVEGNAAPDFMAARLAYRIMGYINKSIDSINQEKHNKE